MWKTAKDKLIEFLQGEIALVRAENLRVKADLEILRADNAELASLSKEAVQLAMQALATPANGRVESNGKTAHASPRTMVQWCQDLTERSYKRERARDPKRNLVAEMPPPSAVKAVNK